MAIFSKINQYLGVNAHANSWLQHMPRKWVSFHHDHVTHLTEALNAVLPPGYEAYSEISLQITEVYPDEPSHRRVRNPQPDITIFDVSGQPRSTPGSSVTAPSGVIPVIDLIDFGPEELGATVVYKVEPNDPPERPIARFELLSPTNKPPNSGYAEYRNKRIMALYSGVPLIEIDYLHEQPPVIKQQGWYPTTPNALPYLIIVSDPRPSVDAGNAYIFRFGVDAPIPMIDIPLDQAEILKQFDLAAAVQSNFRKIAWFAACCGLRSAARQPRLVQRLRPAAHPRTAVYDQSDARRRARLEYGRAVSD